MNCSCGQTKAALAKDDRRPTRSFIEWAVPVTILALTPKCPACLAAYSLMLTGAGLSLPAAAVVRWAMLVVGFGGMAWLLIRTARTGFARRSRKLSATA